MSASGLREDVSEIFFERHHGTWTVQRQAELEARLAADPEFARSYRRIEETWGCLDAHAETPEMVVMRAEALADMQRTGARRWSFGGSGSRWKWAAALAAAVLLAVIVQLSPLGFRPGTVETRIGELRMLELDDHSRIAIDAATRLRVRYSQDARVVELLEGQAQFSVSHDPARPFKVRVGERTIVALGTVFTVEYADRKIHIATLEGRVALLPLTVAAQRLELSAGETLEVRRDGLATVTPKADMEAATAWREGKVILRNETLADAARRMNRYSRVRIEIPDPSLAAERISGVFEAGNSQGFVNDVQRLLAIDAQYPDEQSIELRRR